MKLDECRKAIDAIDTKILDLLNRRAALSRKIGVIKTAAGLPVIDLHREDMVIRRIGRNSTGEVSLDTAVRIYGEILGESRRIQLSIAAEIAANGEPGK